MNDPLLMEGAYEKRVVQTYRDLNVYQQSFDTAMDLFRLTAHFPVEERFSLVDQIRRASRSIPANLAEGWAKRSYENVFKRHLNDSVGSCEELKVWISFAYACGYMDQTQYDELQERYAQIGAMLNSLRDRWKTY